MMMHRGMIVLKKWQQTLEEDRWTRKNVYKTNANVEVNVLKVLLFVLMFGQHWEDILPN
jgi:hypothetical protein